MRLHHLDAERIELARRRRTRASLWVGVAFLLLGASTLPAAMTVTHAVTVIASFALGACLMAAGWPTRRRVVIDRATGTVRDSGVEASLGPDARLRLTGTRRPEDDSGTPLYQVTLTVPGRPAIVLLEGKEPDRVLIALGRLLGALPLPVESGWGLPGDFDPRAHECADPRSIALPPDMDLRVPAVLGRRRLAVLLFALTAFTAVMMTAEVLERIEVGDPVTALDLSLPILTIVALLGVAAAVATYEVRLRTTAGHVMVERRILGLVVSRRIIDRNKRICLYPVAPEEGEPIHLLVVGEAPLSLPEPALIQPILGRSRGSEASLKGG